MKKGTLVAVEFLDHCQASNRLGDEYKPAVCRAVGWVFEDTPEYLSISSWISVDLNSDESDYITIVKHSGMVVSNLGSTKFGKVKS